VKDDKATKSKKPPKRQPPFRKAGSGIEAHGHISTLGEGYDNDDTMHMTVKHGKPKRGGDGILSTYPDESRFTMPADAAQQFKLGQRVRVRVHPLNDADADDAPPKRAKKKGARPR